MLLTKQIDFLRPFIHGTISIVLVLLCLIVAGCQSKPNAVFELLELRTEIKEHCAEYSSEEWEDVFDEYTTICQELDEMQFSDDERIEIDKIKGEIAGYAATVATQEVSDEIKNIANEIESFAEGFSNTFQLPKTEN